VPGNYSSTETVPANWKLTGISCNDGNSSGDVGTATANFVLDPGETVACVFTNTQGGSITVEKQTLPNGSPQAFAFAGDVAGSLADGNSITILVDPGTYTSTETVPAGWDLTSIVCDDSDSTGNIGTATATFNVSADEAVRCVFTNTERGTIIVENQTIPGGSLQSFSFTGDAAGNLIDDGQIIVDNLAPGNYSSTETVPEGWKLTDIVCNDADSTGDIGTATANFVFDAGETVTCVFTNTQRGSITVEKQTLPKGSLQAFDFTGDVAGSLTDGNSITVLVDPGTYT
ncbi:hypothetical protein G4Y73_00010, partial [Wenzhouxiangella sp. XN201]|uniref:prealbumin-like fold domain-containing protein n=1 Tax=Wenzhouxiangella sp. XN201 TaxID=2710755 RepID=UPI0013CC2282